MTRHIALALSLLLAVPFVTAQQRDGLLPRTSPNATVSQTVGVTDVTIAYSRPAVRGRTLFGAEGTGALERYGAVWRLGANEATTITFSTDVQVEGQPLGAGTYALFATPTPDTWTFHFNSEANQWGAFNRDPAKDVLTVEVPAFEGADIEQLMFWFEDVSSTSATVVMGWGALRAGFDIMADTDALIVAAGQAAAQASDWQLPYRYAMYALSQGLDPAMPLAWAERAVTLNNAYATVALKARLQAANGNFEDAITTGEAALSLAEAMENAPGNVGALREAIEEWRERMQ